MFTAAHGKYQCLLRTPTEYSIAILANVSTPCLLLQWTCTLYRHTCHATFVSLEYLVRCHSLTAALVWRHSVIFHSRFCRCTAVQEAWWPLSQGSCLCKLYFHYFVYCRLEKCEQLSVWYSFRKLFRPLLSIFFKFFGAGYRSCSIEWPGKKRL